MSTSPSTTESKRRWPVASVRDKGSLSRAAGWAAAAILTLACALHLYWALGGEWAAATAYGSTDLPPRGIVAVVAALIAASVAVILARIGAWRVRLPAWLLRWSPWALAFVFAFASVNNVLAPEDSYAREWHVFFFGPLLLVVAILSAVIARSPIPDARKERP